MKKIQALTTDILLFTHKRDGIINLLFNVPQMQRLFALLDEVVCEIIENMDESNTELRSHLYQLVQALRRL